MIGLRLIRTGTLRWVMGAYCVIRGAMVLIVPRQFNISFLAPFEPYFALIGSALLAGGVALIAAAGGALPRPLAIAAHLLAGGSLAQVAITSALAGAWSGFASFIILAAGVAAAGLLPDHPQERSDRPPIDLFPLLMALSTLLSGLILLAPLPQFDASLYDGVRSSLPIYGAAFIVSGLLLLAALLHPRAPRKAFVAAHLLVGATLIGWVVGLGLPNWNAQLYYLGLGGAIILLPWLGPRLARFDPALLHARVALVLAGVVVLPLIVAMAFATGQEEQAATEQALLFQRALASAIAEDIAGYIRFHQAATTALALDSDLLSQPEEEQQKRLRRYAALYPDMVFATYSATGEPLARSDDHPNIYSLEGQPSFEKARRTGEPSLEIRISQALERPVFAFSSPVRGEQGEFSGMVVGSLGSERVFAQIDRTLGDIDAMAYVVDASGRVIAHPDSALVATFVDHSTAPPVAALLESGARPGEVRYLDNGTVWLAAYAPLPGMAGGVVIERPAAAALQSVHERRDRDFAVLFLVATGMLITGWGVTRWLARPLTTLAGAAGGLAVGDDSVPLPQSGIVEVAHLAQAFGAMRARLRERTTERDEAEAKVHFLAEASSALAISLDYHATLQTIARIGATGLADYCVVDIADEQGAIRRAAVASASPAHAAAARLQEFSPHPDGESRVAKAIRSGVPDLVPVLSPQARDALAVNEEHRELLRALDPTSLMTVPLIARGRTFGAISLVRCGRSRPYQPDDLMLADELARRAALAIDNARLYREAQEAIGLRDQFLSVASHELKTPLTVLLGNSQLLRRRLTPGSTVTERDQRALRVIAEQGSRLSRMIGMLLDVSRLQIGQLTIELAPVDIEQLVRRVVDELQPSLELHSVALSAEPAPDGRPLIVPGDELRLEQVLQNLLGNAIKYSPEGGAIEVRVEPRGECVAVAVTDHGVGIPSEALPQLFNRFYRAPNVDGARIGGLGIGLFVVAEIVSLHGGRVEVESAVGQGSTFTVLLPLKEPAAG